MRSTRATRQQGYDAFFAANHVAVVRALTFALGDRSRAEDAAQEGFAKAFRQWKRVAAMDRPVSWVYVVALRGARRSIQRELAAPAPDLLGPARDVAEPVAVRLSVAQALDALAPRQRLAVVLRFMADLSIAEVAQAMGISTGTVKATLHAALARLRVDLSPGDLDDDLPLLPIISATTEPAPTAPAPEVAPVWSSSPTVPVPVTAPPTAPTRWVGRNGPLAG